jgi:hypothetical protein
VKAMRLVEQRPGASQAQAATPAPATTR